MPIESFADQPNNNLPKVDLYDPVKLLEEYPNYLDLKLKEDLFSESKDNAEKPKLKDKYDTDSVNEAVNAAIENKVPMVVHIGAPWCGPCRKMEENVWPGVEKDLKGKAAFVHLNGDAILNDNKGGAVGQALTKGIEAFPTIRVVLPQRDANGKVTFKTIASNTGEMTDAGVREMLKKARVGEQHPN